MGITFDSNAGHSTSKSFAASTSETTSSLTLVQNQTIAVAVSILNAGASVSSITDSLGNTYSLAGFAQTASQIRVEIWTTKHTTATGSATVTINLTSAQKNSVCVIQYAGVVSVSSNTSTNTGTGTSTSDSLTTQTPNSWVVGAVALNNSHAFTSGSGTNQRLTIGGNSNAVALADSGNVPNLGTNQTLNETAGANADWAFVAVELQSLVLTAVSASESSSVSDTTQKLKSTTIFESGSVSETVLRGFLPGVLTESTSISDTTKKSLAFVLSSITTVAETLVKSGLFTKNEAIVLADVLVLSRAGKNMFETLFVTDTLGLLRFRSLSETISTSELIQLKNLLIMGEEDVDFEDFLERRALFNREINDIVAILEALAKNTIPFSKFYRSDLLYDVIAGTATLNFYIKDDTTPRVVLSFDASNNSGFPFTRSTSQDNVVPVETYKVALSDEETWIGEIQRRFTSNFVVSPAAQVGRTNSLGIEVLKEPTEPRLQLILRTDGTILRVAASWNNTTKAVTISATPGGQFGLADFIRFLRNSEEFYLMVVDMIQKGG